jgi:iron(III) transport system permease protein
LSRGIPVILLSLPLLAMVAIVPAGGTGAMEGSALLLRSLGLGGGAALLALGIGGGLAGVHYTIPAGGRRLLFDLLLLLLFAASPLGALIFLDRWEPVASLGPGMRSLLVLALWLTPLAAGLVIVAMRTIGQDSLRAAAWIGRGGLGDVWTLWLRPLLPYLAGIFYLLALLAMSREGVPSYFGYHTYAEAFMGRVMLEGSGPEVFPYALPFLFAALLGAALLGGLFWRMALRGRGEASLLPLDRLGGRWSRCVAVTGGGTVGIVLLSMLALFAGDAYADAGAVASAEGALLLLRTFAFDGAVAFVTVLLALTLNALYGPRGKILLLSLLLVYFFLPSSVLAWMLIRLSHLWGVPGAGLSYLLLGTEYLLKTLAVAMGILLLFSLGRRRDPFGRLYTGGRFRFFRIVTLPQIRQELWLAFVAVLVLDLNDIQGTILLAPPGFETVVVRVYNLLHYGALGEVALFLLWQIVGVAILAAALWGFEGRGGSLKRRRHDAT